MAEKEHLFIFFQKCTHLTFDLDPWPCPPFSDLKSWLFWKPRSTLWDNTQ